MQTPNLPPLQLSTLRLTVKVALGFFPPECLVGPFFFWALAPALGVRCCFLDFSVSITRDMFGEPRVPLTKYLKQRISEDLEGVDWDLMEWIFG